jgi:hypothetical protein
MEIIACVGVVAFFVLLFGFLLAWRYFNYLELKALADKGLVKPQNKPATIRNQPVLIWGIIITGIGIALSLGLMPVGRTGTGSMYPFGLGPWMLFGYIPLFFGLSLVLVHVLTGKGRVDEKPEDHPESNDKPEGTDL